MNEMDTEFSLTTHVDLSGLERGMREAAAMVAATTREMKSAFEGAGRSAAGLPKALVEGAHGAEREVAAVWNSMTRTFNTALNAWLAGHESFRRAVRRLWAGLVVDLIGEIEKLTARWILEHTLMAAASTTFHAQETATAGASAAAQAAVNSAKNVAQATGDAGLAAAGTFAWWSGVFPPVAPAMAAAAYAEGLGFAALAAFDYGGIMPATGVALVHQGEGVLTAPVTQMLLQAANEGGFGGGLTLHNHINVQGAGDPERVAQLVGDVVMARVKRHARDRGLA